MTNSASSETITTSSNFSTASFRQRFVAAFIDLFTLTVLIFSLRIAFPNLSNEWFFKYSSPFTDHATHWILSKSSLMGIWIIYSIIMECSALQATVGKQVMGIFVVDDRGNRINLPRSLGRNLYKIISYVVFGLGFVNVLIDKKKRGWHDIIANTLVVKMRRYSSL